MYSSRVVSLFLIFVLLAIPMAWAQDLDAPSRAVPTVKISTPDGDMHIKLVGESDGPVRIPLENNTYASALDITTKIQEKGTVRVVIHGVVDEMTIEPLGTYELELDRDQKSTDSAASISGLITALSSAKGEVGKPIQLYELGRVGVDDWSMQLAGFVASAKGSCECCSCGSLFCCPRAGKCLGCGGCGDCCCTGGGIAYQGETGK